MPHRRTTREVVEVINEQREKAQLEITTLKSALAKTRELIAQSKEKIARSDELLAKIARSRSIPDKSHSNPIRD